MKFNLTFVLVAVSIVVFSITAYYSVGFFHADEHFQIIEFAGLKAGWNEPGNMAWEYFSKIRPTLQPTLAYGFISFLKLLGITDPYTITFLLREITGLLLIFALILFFRNTKQFIRSSKNPSTHKMLEGLYLGFLLLIWYIPFLGVRFSSETWSAIFLILAMACFCSEKKTRKLLFLSGLFFGISFLFRFQILFALAGFGIWSLIFNRKHWKDLLPIGSAFILAFCIGVAIDSWFYGEFTISVWNYFDQNILQHKAAEFGESSWDYYLNQLFHLPTKLIGTLLFLSLAAALIFRNKLPFIWMILSFILLHMIISHKEERFLFPIVFFFPLFFIQFFQLLIDSIPKKIALGLITLTSLGILTTSVVGLPILATEPAGIGRNGTTRFIHNHYGNRPIHLISYPFSNPYFPFLAEERFYREKSLTSTYVTESGELTPQLIKKDTVNLFATRNLNELRYFLGENNRTIRYKLIHRSISNNRLQMNWYIRAINDNATTYLFLLEK